MEDVEDVARLGSEEESKGGGGAERTLLTMTMLDKYMDANSNKYCTFEDNFFASAANHPPS